MYSLTLEPFKIDLLNPWERKYFKHLFGLILVRKHSLHQEIQTSSFFSKSVLEVSMTDLHAVIATSILNCCFLTMRGNLERFSPIW